MGVLLHFFYNKQGTNSIRVDIKFFQLLYLIENYLYGGQDRDFFGICVTYQE